MTSGLSTTTTLLLTFALISLFHRANGNLKATTSLADSPNSQQPERELPVAVSVVTNIGRPGVVLYSLESEGILILTYSVNCSSYDVVYSVVATTSVTNIAAIANAADFNISCATASLKNDTDCEREPTDTTENGEALKNVPTPNVQFCVGVVEGEVNMTVKTNMIGRSFLILSARKISPLETLKINEDQTNNEYLASVRPYEVISSSQSLTGNLSSSHVRSKLSQFHNFSEYGLPPVVVGKALIIVVQLPTAEDKIFQIVLYVTIVLATIGMGVKVEFAVIKKVLRRPTGPIIGICCQYICMPLISYMVAKLVPQESPAISLGIFACGIAPGGGPSNMFTYLLGGDLSLSVTMTTLSSISALGLLPLWLFTLGDTFSDDTVTMHVPYTKILEALAVAILPLFIGMLIKYKAPRVSKVISKILKPVLIVVVAFTISFGVYTNFHIFKMISPMTIFAGCLLPYIGYLVGGFVAFLSCRSWCHIKTIAIETGIQNTGVAFLILFLSLPPPDNQLASVAPASSVVMTPLPLFIAVFIYLIFLRCTKQRQPEEIKSIDLNLENGNATNEKCQVGVEECPREEEMALIILLWRKLKATQPKSYDPSELDTMLQERKAGT